MILVCPMQHQITEGFPSDILVTKVLGATKEGAALIGCRLPPGQIEMNFECDPMSKNAVVIKILSDLDAEKLIEQEITTLTALKSCPHIMDVTESFSFKLSSLPERSSSTLPSAAAIPAAQEKVVQKKRQPPFASPTEPKPTEAVAVTKPTLPGPTKLNVLSKYDILSKLQEQNPAVTSETQLFALVSQL